MDTQTDTLDKWPRTEEELLNIIREAISEANDAGPGAAGYEACPAAMAKAAVAAFNYMAHTLGATGFQASHAGMTFLRVTRGMKGPFAIIDGTQMLYPQYNIPAMVQEWLTDWESWAAAEAQKLLAERHSYAAPRVAEHWERLAAKAPKPPEVTP